MVAVPGRRTGAYFWEVSMDLIEHLAKLSTAVTARVLRNMADALDQQADTDPVQPVVINMTINMNEAPARKLFGRNT